MEKLVMDRRSFLKMALGTGAALGAGLSIPTFAEAKEGLVEEEAEKTVPTFCAVCSGGCAMMGFVKDGRLIHLAGNPDDLASGNPFDPADGGRICVKAHSAISTLYDPDRLKYPMKRTNPKKGIGEDPGFVKISWEEAINESAQGLNQVIQSYGPESIMFLSRSHPFLARLGRAIGTPNFVAHQSTCFTTQEAMWITMLGVGSKPYVYDLENSRYILSFGWDGLGKAKNMHLRNTAKALAKGAKLVVLDPYKSITASRAHEWHPIKPGTDLAFCLAMIHVIVSERLYDRQFVENYTSGFEKLDLLVAKNYTPEWASDITEIPAETIRRIAREFAAASPACIPSHKRDAAGPNYANSFRLAQAQLILNALVGSLDRKGGMMIARNPSFPGLDTVFPRPDFPPARRERIDNWEQNNPIIGHRVVGNFATLADGILNEKPYPLKGALVRGYSPMSFPNTKRIVEALSSLDFMVSCEIYPSEMALLADIVLPEPHWLESSGFGDRGYHALFPQIAVRLPVVEPMYETKGFGGIAVDLAKAMGYEKFFEGVSGGKWNDEQLKAVGTSWDELKSSPNGLWGEKKTFPPRESYNTPSGKIEIYSNRLEEAGFDPLPYWAPRREEPGEEYPLHFLINRPPMHKMTQTQNNPLAMEIYSENDATMHRSTGRRLGIKDGDDVYVESRIGRIRLKAKLIEGIRPDCVMVYHGFGHWAKHLSIAYGKGGNDGELIPDMTFEEMRALKDPGMGACMLDFGVKVYKA